MANKELIKQVQSAVGVAADGLWGPKTAAAVAASLGCGSAVTSIQTCVGAKADGLIGPATLTAILTKLGKSSSAPATTGKLHVFIDPGHTADNAREYPRQFGGADWSAEKPAACLKALGLTKASNDSVEHALNVKIGLALQKELESAGARTTYYDNPTASNNAEIGQVYRKSNALGPDVFVSIHNNASATINWTSAKYNKAAGSVVLYSTKASRNKKLAEAVAASLVKLRNEANGPDNRAGHIATSTVGVLANASSSIAACLVEVCFYDNLDDLYWTCTHINDVAKAIAAGIRAYAGK